MALANNFEHTSATTREFTFEFLEQITDNFSKEHIIGSGGYGVVYKGVLEKGEEIALKKLYWRPDTDDTQFRNELNNLMRVQHPNINQLVGYCYHEGPQRTKHKGEYVTTYVVERVLCFEYLQGGSLDRHISDESRGLDWNTRFKIIKGVCLGLDYLHNGSKDPIYHLDLKPANVLLDKNMVPKIGDFGLSRLFLSKHTHITSKIIGTLGYMPPEYINNQKITPKYDVFSLGVIIIRIIAGDEGYSKIMDMSSQEFLEHVHENWEKRPQATMSSHTSVQVKTCIGIALRCVQDDRKKRPAIAEIVDELSKVSGFRFNLLHPLWLSSWWRNQIIAKLSDLARIAVALVVIVGALAVAWAVIVGTLAVARIVISSVAYLVARIVPLVARIVLSSAGYFILGLAACFILTTLPAATYLGSVVERTRQRTVPYATTIVLGCFLLGSVVSFPNAYFVLGLVVGLWYILHWVAVPATYFLLGSVVGSILATLTTTYFILGLVVSLILLYWATFYLSNC